MGINILNSTGFTAVPNTIGRSRLPHTTVHLVVNLLSHAPGFHASYKLISQQTGMSSSTIAGCLENLKKLGVVNVRKELAKNGENTVNVYDFYSDRLDALTPEIVDEKLRGKTRVKNDPPAAPHFGNQSDPTSTIEATPLRKSKYKKTRSKTTDLKDKHMLISGEKSENDSLPIDVIEPSENEPSSSEKKKGDGKYPADFLEWYAIYPRKKAKGDALKAYRAAMKEVDHATLMEKTRKFVVFVEQSQQEQQYIPYPASWLRASRWEDELEDETPRALPGYHTDVRKPSARDKSAEQLMREQWAREDAQLNNNNQPQTEVFEWPYGVSKEIEH